MSFNIQTKKESNCKNHKFCIFHHTLNMIKLDNIILEILYDNDKLNQLFEPKTKFESNKRLNQLRKFIETKFKNNEEKITDNDIQDSIQSNKNPSYFSFFAEALLARLNIDYIDANLVTGVISIKETIKDGKTGADVCMFSENNLILGEAKFYSKLAGGIKAIIEDSSFKSKLESYCNYIITAEHEIILKSITGDVREMSMDEINNLPFIFTGFVLHTRQIKGNYDMHYNKINNVHIVDLPEHFKIHLYHLPVESKDNLIFKAQRMALNLIIDLKNIKND